MSEFDVALAAAVWLGLLCSISPCPLATNIAAIGFIARNVGNVGAVLAAGALYALGRMVAFVGLGLLLAGGIAAAPELSHLLQKYMNLLMGPLLILIALVLLDWLNINWSGIAVSQTMQQRFGKLGGAGAFLLGIVFALSFCPTSAALFFGSLLPLAVKTNSFGVLPGVFGLAGGIPVLIFAFLLAFAANQVGKVYHRLAKIEVWTQRLTGWVFLVIGVWMTLTISWQIQLW